MAGAVLTVLSTALLTILLVREGEFLPDPYPNSSEVVTTAPQPRDVPDTLGSSVTTATSDVRDDENATRVIQTPVDPEQDREKDIYVMGLFPFSGSWPGGLGQLPAIIMGLEDINKNPNMLPGYRLHMTINNTECDAGKGTNAMYQQLYQKPIKLTIVGAGCSEVSQATAQASHLWNIPQVSYSSASPALSKKGKYKRFYRVFPPESSFNAAKFALLDVFGWRRVGTLYQAINLFSITTERFMKVAKSRGITVQMSESFVNNPQQQVHNLKRNGVRIIIGNFYETYARVIFCEAFKLNMYGAKYAWIITGFYSPGWWREKKTAEEHDCTTEQLEQAIQGYFTTDALPLSLSHTPGISGKTYEQFITEYRKRTPNPPQTGFQEAPYGYDCAWAVADMLNRSLTHMLVNQWNRTLEDFDYQDAEMAQLFMDQMNTTKFEGVSGPVMFDENGDRLGLTQIEQFQGQMEVRVGFFNPLRSTEETITWEPMYPIIWIDGDPPADSITEKVVPMVVSISLFVTMVTLASVGIILTCLFLVFNIRYRHSKYIKMSSPNMNNIILAGAILAFSSIIFGGIDSSLVPTHIHLTMCKFYNWTLALGFSLAFGAMFSKTWRVHKIFTNKKIQRMVIRDYQLMAIVCILVGLDVLVLTVWEFVDPLSITARNKTMQQMPDPNNDAQVLIPQTRFCESPHMWYFAGILYAIKGLLLVFGAFLAFETRKVTVIALNDSKFIGISVYNVVVLCLLGVPIALVMKEHVDASYALISLFILFATLLTICLVFVPKILRRNKEPHSGTMWTTKTMDSGGAKKGCSTATTGLFDMDRQQELDEFKEENLVLKAELEQCQRKLRELEAMHMNGMSPRTTSEDLVLGSEPVTPETPCLAPDRDLDEDDDELRINYGMSDQDSGRETTTRWPTSCPTTPPTRRYSPIDTADDLT